MFRKISIVSLLVIALSVTACGQIQLPTSLPQLPSISQPSVELSPTPDASQQTTPSTAPGSGPKAGRNSNNGVQAPAALLAMFNRLGWEAGVVAQTSSEQIALKTRKDGRDKIPVGANTIFIIPGKTNASINDIHVGDRIIADIPKGQTTAALVMGVPNDYAKDNLVLGMIQSNSNGTITLRARGGADTLTTSSTTQIVRVIREGVALGSVNDLQNGTPVIAIGQASGEEFSTQVIFTMPKGLLDLGKRLGVDRKNPTQPPSPQPGR